MFVRKICDSKKFPWNLRVLFLLQEINLTKEHVQIILTIYVKPNEYWIYGDYS